MIVFDAAVDHGHDHVTPGGDAVQLVQMPERGAGLGRKKWIVAERMESAHRLDPLDAFVARQHFHQMRRRAVRGVFHHVTIDTERRHGPVGYQDQAVRLCQFLCNAMACAVPTVVAVAAGVARIGPVMRGGQVQHDQDLVRRAVVLGRPGITAIAPLACNANRRHGEQGGQEQRAHQGDYVFHCLPPAPSDSAMATAGSWRKFANAWVRSASPTCSK